MADIFGDEAFSVFDQEEKEPKGKDVKKEETKPQQIQK